MHFYQTEIQDFDYSTVKSDFSGDRVRFGKIETGYHAANYQAPAIMFSDLRYRGGPAFDTMSKLAAIRANADVLADEFEGIESVYQIKGYYVVDLTCDDTTTALEIATRMLEAKHCRRAIDSGLYNEYRQEVLSQEIEDYIIDDKIMPRLSEYGQYPTDRLRDNLADDTDLYRQIDKHCHGEAYLSESEAENVAEWVHDKYISPMIAEYQGLAINIAERYGLRADFFLREIRENGIWPHIAGLVLEGETDKADDCIRETAECLSKHAAV